MAHPALAALLLSAAFQESPAENGKILDAIEKAVKAANDGDGPAFASRFDIRRLLDEVYAQAGLDPAREKTGKESTERLLKPALELTIDYCSKLGVEWGEVRNARIRRLKGGTEAEVSCILKDSLGAKEPYRFWTVKGEAGWKIFDFESVAGGIRLSVIMAGFLSRSDDAPQKLAALRPSTLALQRAVNHIAAGMTQEALEEIRAIRVEEFPDAWAAVVEMLEASILFDEWKLGETLAALERCLRRKPDLPRALRLKSEICRELKRPEDVIEAETAHLKIIAGDADAYYNIGYACREIGRIEDAVEAHRKGAACDPEDLRNRLLLWVLLAERGRTEEAKKHLEDALSLSLELMKTQAMELLLHIARRQAAERPSEPEPLHHLGHALRRLARPDEARRILEKVREADKDELLSSEIAEELACTLAHLDMAAEAMETADKPEGKNESLAVYVRAYVHAATGKDFDAVRAMRLALMAEARVKESPDDCDAWHHLGASLRRMGRHDAAEKALRTGLEKEDAEEKRQRFWEDLGHAIARGGRPKEALEWSARLLERDGWTAEGHYLAAAAHALSDDRKSAMASLRKLLESDPDQLEEVEADPAFQELRSDPDYVSLIRRHRDRNRVE